MSEIFHYEFMRNALLVGTFVALVGGITGFFMLQRGLTFAGHALPGIGFAGAAGAVWLGFPPLAGLVVFTLAGGAAISALGRETRERDLNIGMILVFALGLGLMFISLYSGFAERIYGILFGSILGISTTEAWEIAAGALLLALVLMVFFRPLLFSSFDPQAARARGVPTSFLSVLFLSTVALVVALCVPITGSLLVFTLLVGPAAVATRLSSSPKRALVLAVIVGEVLVWSSMILAWIAGTIPVSFFVALLAFVAYILARAFDALRPRRRAGRRQG
jgi:zinc/manganese transport system permease protein